MRREDVQLRLKIGSAEYEDETWCGIRVPWVDCGGRCIKFMAQQSCLQSFTCLHEVSGPCITTILATFCWRYDDDATLEGEREVFGGSVRTE